MRGSVYSLRFRGVSPSTSVLADPKRDEDTIEWSSESRQLRLFQKARMALKHGLNGALSTCRPALPPERQRRPSVHWPGWRNRDFCQPPVVVPPFLNQRLRWRKFLEPLLCLLNCVLPDGALRGFCPHDVGQPVCLVSHNELVIPLRGLGLAQQSLQA